MQRGFFLAIIAMFILTSCSDVTKKEEQKAAGPSTGEIVNKYVNTLTDAKPRAEKSTLAESNRIKEQDKIMKEMEK